MKIATNTTRINNIHDALNMSNLSLINPNSSASGIMKIRVMVLTAEAEPARTEEGNESWSMRFEDNTYSNC